ncbi:hypothetical protein AVEN_133283-1 [Araneus ventricosus]|uniref:Integrase catalytic domain-containing protein n=1 Tax=Araneus ventricosus TaxID=182803 RepID=A0A4Y2DLD7_ARAVE|nr:hypothetical protein AVEN_133283-1 [Araneus ventricosus]
MCRNVSLTNATAREFATVHMEVVFLRFGLPKRVILDNINCNTLLCNKCYILKIHKSFIPVYHSQANPVERKNRDLKPRLAILVEDQHDSSLGVKNSTPSDLQ